MAKFRLIEQGHLIRKRHGTWIIAVPPEVREALGVTHRMLLYWQLRRDGECVLASSAKAKEGAPPVRKLARELAIARAEVTNIRKRDEYRDRSMYAEGFAHGYVQAYERLASPTGPSAERGHRRSMFRWAHPIAAQLSDPKQAAPRPAPSSPRPNARTRRAKRETSASARQVETVSAPMLDAPVFEETPA